MIGVHIFNPRHEAVKAPSLLSVDVVYSSLGPLTQTLLMETPNICFTKATKEKENCIKGAYFLCDRLNLFPSSEPRRPASSSLPLVYATSFWPLLGHLEIDLLLTTIQRAASLINESIHEYEIIYY
jgi:hypothetical protein